MTRPNPITLPELFFAAACCWFGAAGVAATQGREAGFGLALADVLLWLAIISALVGLGLLIGRALAILADCAINRVRPDQDGVTREDRL